MIILRMHGHVSAMGSHEDIPLIAHTHYAMLQEMSDFPVQVQRDDCKQNSEGIRRRISRWMANLSKIDPLTVELGFECGRLCPIETFCNILECSLNIHSAYKGHFLEFGSSVYAEGKRVAKTGKLDFHLLYIIQGDVQIRAYGDPGLYMVFKKGKEIGPWILNEYLADDIDKIMSEICLPWPLQHGGYAHPEYSGVRINGPAVSVSVTGKLEGMDSCVILHITPAFLLPAYCWEEYEYVRGQIKRILANNTLQSPYSRDFLRLHVVPHPLKNLWQPSTAHMESHIRKELSEFSPLRMAFPLTRIFLVHQEKHRQRKPMATSSPSDKSVSIVNALERYSQIAGEEEKDTYRLQLNTKMRYQHIYLPPEARSKFREVSKSAISVDTTALEHIIWSSAIETSNFFSSYSRNWESLEKIITRQLVREVYKELANTESLSVCHALLPLTLSKFSVLPSSLDEAAQLVNTVQEECAAMLDTFLKDDFVSPVNFAIG